MIITVAELLNKLTARSGSMIVAIDADTDARAKKTGNPYGAIRKVSHVTGMVNFHYDAGVLRRLEKEGKSADDFKKGESWHEPALDVDGKLTPFCRHKTTGDLYLRLMHLSSGETVYFGEDGKPLTAEQVAPFLPKKNSYANQGLEQPLVFLTYKLDSLRSITIDGESFVIEHDETIQQVLAREEKKLEEMMA